MADKGAQPRSRLLIKKVAVNDATQVRIDLG